MRKITGYVFTNSEGFIATDDWIPFVVNNIMNAKLFLTIDEAEKYKNLFLKRPSEENASLWKLNSIYLDYI